MLLSYPGQEGLLLFRSCSGHRAYFREEDSGCGHLPVVHRKLNLSLEVTSLHAHVSGVSLYHSAHHTYLSVSV